MCYFPIFLHTLFVFMSCKVFIKKLTLMTMTITGMCTGEVIKRMTR